MAYTYNGMSFSHMKKEILPCCAIWKKLEDFVLSEISLYYLGPEVV